MPRRMNRRVPFCVILTTAIFLSGCNRTPTSSSFPESSVQSSFSSTLTSTTEAQTAATTTTTLTTAEGTTVTTTVIKPVSTTTQTSSAKTSATTASATSATTTRPPTADPDRVTVNGKVYAVGDTFQYTVRVKTAENYGRVNIAVRYIQKGLEIPNGLPIKQQQAVSSNLGIGLLVGPEESASKNGFTVTANKGLGLDSSITGYAGMVRFYETTNYDSNAQAYRPIDCSNGATLYTVTLKITKPGEYLVDCFEYPSKSRTDLTVWGEITA